MMLQVNLLPQAYRQAQARRRRIRVGVTCVVVMLSLEVMVGLVFHVRAGRARELLAAARTARTSAESIRQKMKAPAQEATLLAQQLTLARKLRTTHQWSRLLGLLAQSASSRVTLVAVATDPPKWTQTLSLHETAAAPTRGKTEAPLLLEGLNVRGYAVDHDDLARFISRLQAADAFATLSLKEARRDKYMEQDVISFEIECRW